LIKLLYITTALLFTLTVDAAPVTGVDRILAVVNSDIILKSEFDRELSAITQRLNNQGIKLPPIETLTQQLLEKMIIEQLQLQVAEGSGIIINESTVNSTIQRIAKRNNLSLSQFKQALDSQGTDYSNFRDKLKREITIERLKIKKIDNKINISDNEAEQLANRLTSDSANALRQYKLSHILIPLPDKASSIEIKIAKEKSNAILKQLLNGADFIQTAMEQSGSNDALEGGTLDWRTISELPTIFAKQLPQLKLKPFVGPIRSISGFHILSLIETREQLTTHTVALSHARHILLKSSELITDHEIKARLEIIRERILGGESFEELARTNSEDGSAKNGGDLGWQNPENLVPEFVKEMDKLAPDEVSPVFKSRFGWHIIKMLRRKQEDNTEEFIMSQARQMIRKRKVSEATENWLRRLRDEAYIEYRLDDI